MMRQVPQIKTVIPMTNSIFSHMDYEFGMIEASQLDLLFSTNYGERNISPVVDRIVADMDSVTDSELTELANLLLSIYRKKWDRYKEIHSMEYDMIHNYLDEYTESVTLVTSETSEGNSEMSDTSSENSTETKTRTDDLQKSTSYTSDETRNGTDDSKIYGFNSTEAVNTDTNSENSETGIESTSDESNTGTQTYANSSERERNLTRTNSTDSATDATQNKDRTFTHKGNIGNLTTQELIRQEIKLWEWNFIESVLNDAKDLLTLPIYLS